MSAHLNDIVNRLDGIAKDCAYARAPLTDGVKRTVLATATMYPSRNGQMADDVALRARLALATIWSARHHGYGRIIVVDGSSDTGWRQEARGLGATLIDESPSLYPSVPGVKGFGPGRRQALAIAANEPADAIVWIEPEKYPLVHATDFNDSSNVQFSGRTPLAAAAVPVLEGTADIVIPRRMDDLRSYPIQQRAMELAGNRMVQALLREAWRRESATRPESEERVPYIDQWFGPRIMAPDAVSYFTAYRGEQGDRWESIFVPVWRAIMDGKRVIDTPVDYTHPMEQTALESSSPAYDLKREEQLLTIVRAAQAFVDGRY